MTFQGKFVLSCRYGYHPNDISVIFLCWKLSDAQSFISRKLYNLINSLYVVYKKPQRRDRRTHGNQFRWKNKNKTGLNSLKNSCKDPILGYSRHIFFSFYLRARGIKDNTLNNGWNINRRRIYYSMCWMQFRQLKLYLFP